MQKFAPFLKLYSEYVKNFDNAMETITYWLDKCPRFLQIVKDIQVSVMLLAVARGLQLDHNNSYITTFSSSVGLILNMVCSIRSDFNSFCSGVVE